MVRFLLEESSEEEGATKKMRFNEGEMENLETEEEEKEESDEGGEEEEDDGDVGGSDSDRELSFRIDADVLDCSICFEPLRPPIFQCTNGHIACSSCCPKLLNRCHVCSRVIGRSRCLALEKVVESIRIRCRFASYGCKAFPSLSEKVSHEETCSHAPLFCPFSGCTFSGPTHPLAAHAQQKHRDAVKKFLYDQPFMVTLTRQEPFVALLSEDSHLCLLLNCSGILPGNTLSLILISSNRAECVFAYELRVQGRGSSLQLRASAEAVRTLVGVHPSKAFLMVPDDFCASHVQIDVNVCIRKSSVYLS